MFERLFSKKSNTPVETKESSQHNYFPEARSYVLMKAATYYGDLDVNSILAGNRDHAYVKKNDRESINFTLDCTLCESLESVLEEARFKGGESSKSTYIMIMGYSTEEVKLLASQGNFSKGIISAINAKDLSEATRGIRALSSVEKIVNNNFNGNLDSHRPR